MFRFQFFHDPDSNITYAPIGVDEHRLLVINLATVGALPDWLREHVANESAKALDPKPGSKKAEVIDLAAARQIKAALAAAQ